MFERGLAVLFAALVVAGCTAADNGAPPTTSSPAPEPKPLKTVVDKEVSGCAQGGSPAPTAPTLVNFDIPGGYDTMIIAFHEAGVGQRAAVIYNVENQRSPIWEKKQENVNTLPTNCGGHSHGGDGESKKVEPGSYTARISYSGTLSMHLTVIIKNSTATQTTSPTHSHSAS